MAFELDRARRAHRLAALGAVLAIALGAAGCGGDDSMEPESETAATLTVEARDFSFAPAELEISPGEEVTWTNDGEEIHNVRGEGFFSEAIEAGENYRHRFAEPGRYAYLCTLHPTTMRGVIEVTRGRPRVR